MTEEEKTNIINKELKIQFAIFDRVGLQYDDEMIAGTAEYFFDLGRARASDLVSKMRSQWINSVHKDECLAFLKSCGRKDHPELTDGKDEPT